MQRFLVFLVAIPVIALGVLISSAQLSLSDVQINNTPADWPSSIPAQGDATVPPIIDLSIRKTASNNPATIGTPLTYTIVISNTGQDDAEAVILADVLPSNATFSFAASTQGPCSGVQLVVCDMGIVQSGGVPVTATIVVVPTGGTSLSNNAYVTSFEAVDTDESNNTTLLETALSPASFKVYLPLIVR